MGKFLNSEHERAYQLMIDESFESSLKIYDNLIYLFQDVPDLYADRAVIYLHLKKKELSFEDFNKALSLQPEYGYRYAARAFAKDYFGDTEGAIEDYEKAVQLDPEDAVAYNNLGLLLEKLGNKKKAQRHFDKADDLSKMNDALQEAIKDTGLLKSEEKPISELAKNEVLTSKSGVLKEMFNIFRSKEEFKSFLRFIKNGGKLDGNK
jgi:tetratricopeptide (TPR) repeat protein